MAFRIYDTNVTKVFVNAVTNRIGSGIFLLKTTTQPSIDNYVVGISFQLSSKQELTAFSIKKDMWIGDGDTRECGIYKLDQTLLVKATISKQSSALFNDEYFTILSQPVTLLKDTRYMMVSTLKIGESVTDGDANRVDPSNYNYTVLTDIPNNKFYYEKSDIFKFPDDIEEQADGVTSFINAYLTTIYN
jgi:hypothetical protein